MRFQDCQLPTLLQESQHQELTSGPANEGDSIGRHRKFDRGCKITKTILDQKYVEEHHLGKKSQKECPQPSVDVEVNKQDNLRLGISSITAAAIHSPLIMKPQ